MILPVRLGLNYISPQPKTIKANDYLMGEKYIESYNHALAVMPNIESLDLRNNRLGGDAAKKLFKAQEHIETKKNYKREQSKITPEVVVHCNLLTLDLSQNPKLPFETYATLSNMVEDSYNLLQVLNLEGNKMGDEAMISICSRTHYNNCLKILNVNNNLITCKSMKSVSGMLQFSTITSLFMSWNCIAAAG